MTTKDRIALVVTVIYGLFLIFIFLEGNNEELITFTLPVVIYWGYRFIKNDISFINNKET